MAEDDGSFAAAKAHGKSNNHEVIEHIKNMAPADATAVKKVVPYNEQATRAQQKSVNASMVADSAASGQVNGFLGSNLDIYVAAHGRERDEKQKEKEANANDATNKQKSDSVRKSLNIK